MGLYQQLNQQDQTIGPAKSLKVSSLASFEFIFFSTFLFYSSLSIFFLLLFFFFFSCLASFDNTRQTKQKGASTLISEPLHASLG
jgi:hypothetical protein